MSLIHRVRGVLAQRDSATVPAMRAAEIAALLERHRFRFTSERELQEGVALAFGRASIDFVREASLSGMGTIDFLVEGGVGVELKIGGTLAETTRQLHRYAGHPTVRELLLVTSSARLGRGNELPTSMQGKPLHVARLLRSIL